jgi:hypothetical protein
MSTYSQVHAGTVVLGHDDKLWGVAEITHTPRLSVTLVRGEQRITGYPPPDTPVTIVTPADVSAEMRAAQALIDAGIMPEIVSEKWES